MATDVDRHVDDALARLSLEQKVGQLFVTHVYGADADYPSPEDAARNLQVYGCATGAEVVRRYHLGGVVYVGWAGNLATPAQLACLSNGLQRAAVGDGDGVPLVVATVQEHGAVARLAPQFTELPANLALGASGSATHAEQAAEVTGRELRAVGVGQIYAPGVDVTVDPAGRVANVQSYGSDPELVARLAVAQTRGFQDAGVVATVKHFPGHTGGRAKEEWERVDAVPFRAVVEAGVDAVMCGHAIVPALDPERVPTTLSAPILTGLLRDELAFDRVVVTDSLALQGVRASHADERVPVLALLAGADQLLMPPDLDLAQRSVLDAVRGGELTEERIDRSVERILRMKYARGVTERVEVDENGVDAVVGTQRHRDTALHVTDRTVTLVRDDDGTLPMDPAWQAVLVVGCGTGAAESLSEALAQHCGWTCAVDAGALPGPDETKVAVARAKHHDVVIVLTGDAPDGAGEEAAAGRRSLVSALLATRTPVVVVATRDPYDIAHHPDAPTCLVTYSDSRTSMRSLARVLVGEVEPLGTLPVAVLTGRDEDTGSDNRASVA